jgi:hypothetical protein
MESVLIKVGKQHHPFLRTKRFQELVKKTGVSIKIPRKNERSEIISLTGNTSQFAVTMNQIVRGISSTAKPYKITAYEDIYSIEPVYKAKKKEKNEKKKQKEREIDKTSKEEKGRGEENISDSDYDEFDLIRESNS